MICSAGPYILTVPLHLWCILRFQCSAGNKNKVTSIHCVFKVFQSFRQELTLTAGLASEARVALALVGSHALSVLTARLAHSCSWRILREEETDHCGVLADVFYQIKMTKHLIALLLYFLKPLAVNYVFTPRYKNKTA